MTTAAAAAVSTVAAGQDFVAAGRQNPAARHNNNHGRTSSIVSLPDDDSPLTAMEARKKQNRESARKARLRKKLKEQALRGDVAFYNRSNESLAKQNVELQLMLDVARAKVASSVTLPSEVSQIQVARPQMATPAPMPKVELLDTLQASNNGRVVSPMNVGVDLDAISDQVVGYDPIDILLESDDWFLEDKDDNVSDGTATSASSVASSIDDIPIIEPRAHQTISPNKVMSNPIPVPSNRQVSVAGPTRSSRASDVANDKKRCAPVAIVSVKDKKRRYARNARLRKKAEHEKLRASAQYYVRANEELKEKNRQLQLMLLRARNTVAEATDGFEHYSSVFGDGNNAPDGSTSPPAGDQCCGKSIVGDARPSSLHTNAKHDQLRRSSISHIDFDVDIDMGAITSSDEEEWMSYLLE